jgi:CRISP-associated protein Cas1
MERNLKMLTRLESTIGFLYLEHASIERENYALVINKNGGSTAIPCASLASLVLGPGTSITHAAVTTLAECGTSIIWAGQDSQRFYASGIGKNRSSRHIQLQAKAWANQHERLRVVRDLYRLRFTEGLPKHLSIQQFVAGKACGFEIPT